MAAFQYIRTLTLLFTALILQDVHNHTSRLSANTRSDRTVECGAGDVLAAGQRMSAEPFGGADCCCDRAVRPVGVLGSALLDREYLEARGHRCDLHVGEFARSRVRVAI